MKIETLVKIGGKEWQKNGKHRVYFNDLEGLAGLECSHYNTGNISSARLNGERISNSSARKIGQALCSAKIWYDVADQEFHYSTYGGETIAREIIAEIVRRAQTVESTATE